MTVLAALVAGHLLADFVFQSDRVVAKKRAAPTRLAGLGAHTAVVAATPVGVVLLADGWDVKAISAALLLSILHGVQDFFKEACTGRSRQPLLLVLDQALHLAVIAAVSWAIGIVHPVPAVASFVLVIRRPSVFEAVALVLAGTWAAGVFLRDALSRLLPHEAEDEAATLDSLDGPFPRQWQIIEGMPARSHLASGPLTASGICVARRGMLLGFLPGFALPNLM